MIQSTVLLRHDVVSHIEQDAKNFRQLIEDVILSRLKLTTYKEQKQKTSANSLNTYSYYY